MTLLTVKKILENIIQIHGRERGLWLLTPPRPLHAWKSYFFADNSFKQIWVAQDGGLLQISSHIFTYESIFSDAISPFPSPPLPAPLV